jgi:hypothetical protein
MKMVVMSDGEVSEEELEHVEMLVGAFGDEGYAAALDAFERRFGDEASFRKFLESIRRQDARDLVFGTVLESAGEAAIEGSEASLLDWLSTSWNIKIEIADSPGG